MYIIKQHSTNHHSFGGEKEPKQLKFVSAISSTQYLIVKLDGVEELVIVADSLETYIPPAPDTGIFNVVTQHDTDHRLWTNSHNRSIHQCDSIGWKPQTDLHPSKEVPPSVQQGQQNGLLNHVSTPW
jgi:hypothetical protein